MRVQAMNKKKISIMVGLIFSSLGAMNVSAQNIDLSNLEDGEVYIIKKVKASDLEKQNKVSSAPVAAPTRVSTPVVQTPAVQRVERVQIELSPTVIATPSVQPQSPNQAVIRQAGYNVALLEAMKTLTPEGWLVKKDDKKNGRVDLKQRVSWSAGSGWIDTYQQIAQQADLDFQVNHSNKTVTISNASETFIAPPQEAAVFQLAGEGKPNGFVDASNRNHPRVVETGGRVSVVGIETVSYSSQVPQRGGAPVQTLKQVAAAEVTVSEGDLRVPNVGLEKDEFVPKTLSPTPVSNTAPIPTQEQWVVDATKTLRENVTDWGKKAGYNVVWSGEDYRPDQRVLLGQFASEGGPIHQLSIDYGPRSRVRVPLSFDFYENKTLVVENWRFEQADHPQYSKP